MILPLVLTPFATKALEKAVDAVAEVAKAGRTAKVRIEQSDARTCLLGQLNTVRAWAESISIMSLLRDKSLRESFVELGFDVGLVRDGSRKASAVDLAAVDAAGGHAVLLGGPGAGKTTSLQRLAQTALERWQAGAGGAPVLARLRDLRGDDTLTSHLLALFGISVQAPKPEKREDIVPSAALRQAWERRAALAYLAQVSAVLLIDGLDEVSPHVRAVVETELRDIALAAGEHRLYLTCRTAEYHIRLQNVQAYTIRPLSREQVARFAERWLGERAPAFLDSVRRNPYAGAEVVPLTLAHLCAIYERDGELPPRPIDVYEQIVGLLIEEWDRERGVRRASRYADFTWRKKERFLQAAAYHLAMRGLRGSFTEQDLAAVYGAVAPEFGLPADEASAVIEEVESHTGLVQLSGHKRYDFVHLVIQEFLSAMYAHRRADAVRDLVPGYPNELALVVAYSTSPEAYLEQVLGVVFAQHFGGNLLDFLPPFLARLATEQPTWQAPTKRAGWTFLALFDLATRHQLAVDERLRLRVPREVARLASEPAVVEAVRLALQDSTRFDEQRAVRVIPRGGPHLPAALTDHLRGRSDAGLVLLRGQPAFERLLSRGRRGRGSTGRVGKPRG